MNTSHQELLRSLPPVTELIEDGRLAELIEVSGREALREWIRVSLDETRGWLLSQDASQADVTREALCERVVAGALRAGHAGGGDADWDRGADPARLHWGATVPHHTN